MVDDFPKFYELMYNVPNPYSMDYVLELKFHQNWNLS